MSYPLNREECKQKDDFLKELLESKWDYVFELSGIDHYEFIKEYKPELLRIGEDTVSVSQIGVQFIKNGGFIRDENNYRIKSRKEALLLDITIKEKVQNVFAKPIMMIISVITFLYTLLDILQSLI